MAKSETDRLLGAGASMTSRGFLTLMTSCILDLRNRVLSIRRRPLLVVILIFTMAIFVLQVQEQSFFHGLKTKSWNPLAPGSRLRNTSNIVKKTAFEAVTAVSGPHSSADSDSGLVHNGYGTGARRKENDEVDEESESRNGHRSSISSPIQQHQAPTSHSDDEKHTLTVAENNEQEDIRPANQNKALEGARDLDSQDPRISNTTTQSREISVQDEDRHGVARSARAGDHETLDASKNAVDKQPKSPDSRESDVPGSKTQTVSIDSTADVFHNLHTNKSVKDIGYTRTKCYSVSGEPREHTCAPSVVIAGYEKCGTSALYYKLTKHPEIVAHPKWKEHCPSEDSLEAMWSWFELMPVLENSTSNGLLLNGCIGIVSTPLILKELQRLNRDLKVLVALRNYADWSYSFYGYRCYPGYDEGCEKLEKPTTHGPWKETRNPENFAELVKVIEGTGKSPYKAFGVIQPNAYLFRPWLEELIDAVGPKAVKVIKQEDLSDIPQETLANVAHFLEIDATQFPSDAYALVSNTNDHPAEITYVNETETNAEISDVINSGAVVLDETRTLLNKFWKSECEWLRDNFDVHFSDAC